MTSGDAEEHIALLEKQSDDDPPASSGRRADYDTALSACGFGRFQYWLIFTVGWANASDAVELLCVSSLLPAAECDLNMSPQQKGYLSSSAFVGLMIGGYIWGGLGDAVGRRTMLVTALLFNAFFGLLSSVMQTYLPFLLCRFLSGVGVGGAVPLVFSYFAEFSPKEYRGRMISWVSYFWIIGNIVVAGLAWIVIPLDIGYSSSKFQFTSWRVFVVLSCYYGLWVWFPELFNRLEQYNTAHPGASTSVCDIIDATVSGNATDPCATATDLSTYRDEFIVAAAPLLLNVWTLVHMDKLGRKFFVVIGMMLSGVSVFLIYIVKETWQNLVLSCLFGSVSNLSFSAINCFSAELFPTKLRSTAIAVTIAAARIGAILGTTVFGQLLYINCAVPLLLVAALLVGGGLLSCLLPNTTGTSLQ